MIERFVSSNLASELKIDSIKFINFMKNYLNYFSYRHQKKNVKEYIHDKQITNKLFIEIKKYIKNRIHKTTQKNNNINRNKTYKKSKFPH